MVYSSTVYEWLPQKGYEPSVKQYSEIRNHVHSEENPKTMV